METGKNTFITDRSIISWTTDMIYCGIKGREMAAGAFPPTESL